MCFYNIYWCSDASKMSITVVLINKHKELQVHFNFVAVFNISYTNLTLIPQH